MADGCVMLTSDTVKEELRILNEGNGSRRC